MTKHYQIYPKAGIQTTTETLYWALAFMVEHRDIQSRCQAEIDKAIGRKRLPVVDDRGSLPYTEATLYEVMRYSSILPIAVPHATTCDVNFRESVTLFFTFFFFSKEKLYSIILEQEQRNRFE